MRGLKDLLLRSAERYENDVGTRRSDPCHSLCLSPSVVVPVLRAGDDEPGMSRAHGFNCKFEHVTLSSEQEDPVAAELSAFEQSIHQVDARDSLGNRVPGKSRRPNDRLAVRSDKFATPKRVGKGRIPA